MTRSQFRRMSFHAFRVKMTILHTPKQHKVELIHVGEVVSIQQRIPCRLIFVGHALLSMLVQVLRRVSSLEVFNRWGLAWFVKAPA